MFKLLFIVFALHFTMFVHGQTPHFTPFSDTLATDDRSSGKYLELADRFFLDPQNLLPSNQTILGQFTRKIPRYFFKFSSIPHVGLKYTLGSAFTQLGSISYSQALDTGVFFGFEYNRFSTNGVLRNSKRDFTSVSAKLRIEKSHLLCLIKLDFSGENSQLSGGLLGDSIQNDLGLTFQNVYKETANQQVKNIHISVSNYFSLKSNDALKTGIFAHPEFSIANRRFTESGQLSVSYSQIFVDSFNTSDLWQKSQVGVKSGLYLEKKRFFIEGGIYSYYWDFDNLQNHLDTLELGFFGKGNYAINDKLKFDGSINLGLAGNVGESDYNVGGFYTDSVWNFSLNTSYTTRFPSLNERHFSGNNLNYTWSNKLLEKRWILDFTLKYKMIFLSGMLNQISNPIVFLNNKFRQDTIPNMLFLQFKLGYEKRFNHFFVYPFVIVNQSFNSILPQLEANIRTGFTGFITKSKKLKSSIGLDLGFRGKYNLMDYAPIVDSYVFNASSSQNRAIPKLNVFNNYDLGFLRWFIRIENIEQLFISPNYDIVAYPMAPFQFRFGVSWDLFN